MPKALELARKLTDDIHAALPDDPVGRVFAAAVALQFLVHETVDVIAMRKSHREVGGEAVDEAERILAESGIAAELAQQLHAAAYVEEPPPAVKPDSPWVKP